jgi:hypothetical protein
MLHATAFLNEKEAEGLFTKIMDAQTVVPSDTWRQLKAYLTPI